jgi:hypothetical protein
MQISKSLPYVACAGCAMLYFAPFLRVLSHSGDEGTLIMGAVRVLDGQLPSRDFFEAMGPGTFYWLALFFKLLGTTWLATRICLLVTTAIISVVLYYLARRLRPGLEAIPVIFFVAVSYHSWNAISHHMDSNLFALLAFLLLLFWTDQRRPYFLFLAGFSAGLTTWIMQPKGVMLFSSFLLLVWMLCRKEPAFWPSVRTLLGGYLTVMVTVVALFWAAGGLPELIYSNITWPLQQYSGTNAVPYGKEFLELYWTSFTTSLRQVISPFAAIAISGFLSVPFIAVMGLPLALAAILATYRGAAFDRTTLPYWVTGCALWLSEMHRKDVAHIVYGAPILIILAFYYCRRTNLRTVRYAVQLVAICAVVLAALNPLVALAAQTKLVTRRGTVYDAFHGNPVLDFLNARVPPGESVFVYPYAPLYYFLSAAKNPTRYSVLMYRINPDGQFQDAVRSLEASKPRYVIWDRSFPKWVNVWFPAYRIPQPDQLIVEPYLTDHYTVIGGTESGYQFLQRKESVEMSQNRPIQLEALSQ